MPSSRCWPISGEMILEALRAERAELVVDQAEAHLGAVEQLLQVVVEHLGDAFALLLLGADEPGGERTELAVAAFEIRRAGRHGRFQVLVELSQFVLGTQPLVGEGEVVDDGFHDRDEVVVEATRTAGAERQRRRGRRPDHHREGQA